MFRHLRKTALGPQHFCRRGLRFRRASGLSRAITLVVPYGAGGDRSCRSRIGGNGAQTYRRPADYRREQARVGMSGARFVSESDPDGYTLLLSRVAWPFTRPFAR